jgi:type I site-specific restriction endonuclease
MTKQLKLPEPTELSEDSFFGPVIYAYTRAQAIADGVLVDVTETAKETGFKLPVVITEALHSRLTPTKADQGLGQDYDGRLWDVLWLASSWPTAARIP